MGNETRWLTLEDIICSRSSNKSFLFFILTIHSCVIISKKPIGNVIVVSLTLFVYIYESVFTAHRISGCYFLCLSDAFHLHLCSLMLWRCEHQLEVGTPVGSDI